VHIPSERVRNEMASMPAGVWFVHSEGTDTHAVLLKCQGNVLKAITQGCSVEAIFGVAEIGGRKILCTAVKIHDDLSSPYIISCPQVCLEDHRALIEILRRESTPLFLFDELCRCVAWAEASLESEKVQEVEEGIGNIKDLYSGKTDSDVSRALDCLDLSVAPERIIPGARIVPIVKIVLSCGEFVHTEIHSYSIYESHAFNLENRDEGGGLEQSVWQLLESIFPLDIYRSPQVEDGKNYRELTDILCLSEFGLFLFEAKAISVYSATSGRDTKRRVKNLQKQVRTGIRQLKGAVRMIRSGKKITTNSGAEIKLNREIVPHAVVPVSELLHFGNWDEIVADILNAAKDLNMLIHVLDLRELTLLVASSREANLFDYQLMERFKNFVSFNSIHLRGEMPKY
jgi:hypothetical protein